MRKLLCFLVLLSSPAFATVHFLRVGATGSNNGSSWTNAYPSTTTMNTASSGWAAGDFLCIATGTYTGQGIVPGATGTSGHPITYQASAIADPVCGSATSGWSNAFAGQVTINGGALFSNGLTTNFITFDGLTYSNTEGASGMFMPIANTSGDPSAIGVAGPTTGVIIRNIDIGVTGCGPSGCNQNGDSRTIDLNHFNGSSYDLQTNVLIQFANLHGACTIMWSAHSTNLIVEHSRFADSIDNTPGNPNCHPNVFAAQDTTGTFRYNEVTNWQVEGILVCPTSGCSSTWDIYGNIWHDPTGGSFPRVYETQNATCTTAHAYNNTFINIPFATFTTSAGGNYCSGSQGLNNIYISSSGSGLPANDFDACNGSTCGETHGQNIATSIFTNFSAGTVAGYTLASNTATGSTLSSPFNLDFAGTTRGANGTWDRGFFQITGGAPVLTTITVLPNPATTTTLGTVNMQTSSFCTFSDLSTVAAGSTGCVVVWTDTAAHSSINSSTGIVTGASVGSDTVTATLSPATPGTATVNITIPPPQTYTVDPTNGNVNRYDAIKNPTGVANGKGTAACSGSTPNQTCPFGDVESLWNIIGISGDAAWFLNPGDTVNIKNCIASTGSACKIAGDDNATSGHHCFGIGTNCIPPPMPSGTSGLPITIQSSLCPSGCFITIQAPNTTSPFYQYQGLDPTKAAYIWAGNAAFWAINLETSQFVSMHGIDLSDHSPCGVAATPDPGGPSPACGSESASHGLFTDNATVPTNGNIILTDMNIHGFSAKGIIGNIGGPWTATRVQILGNGQTGWDLDPGGGEQSIGTITGNNLIIAFNGCSEEFPKTDTIPYTNCVGQSNGGQGDGMGTPVTGNTNFICDHCAAFYNTQDGMDWGHAFGGTLQITNSFFFGNNGGNIKVGPMQTVNVYNNLVISGCVRMSQPITGMPSGFNGNLADFCRANAANGINVQSNASFVLNAAGTGTAGITCSGTTCTSANGFSGLSNGQHVMTQVGTLAADNRTISAVSSPTFTISSAFTHPPPGGSDPDLVILLPTTPASTSVVHAYHNTIATYSQTFDNQCQIAMSIGSQNQVDPALCAGYVWDLQDNILLAYGDPNWCGNGGCSNTPANFPELQPSHEDYNDCSGFSATPICVNTHDITSSPLLLSQPATPIVNESDLDNFNFNQTSSSPSKFTGVAGLGLSTDFNGVTWNSTPSMGAVEFTATPTVATPTPSPVAGMYSGAQTVTLSTVTGGASIFYTLDGSTPTPASTLYTAPLTISSTTTVKAIAALAGQVIQNAQSSLTNWLECYIGHCSGGGTPGGSGTPSTVLQTINNASPSLSGASMLLSQTTSQNLTNVLWYNKVGGCDTCTNGNADFYAFPVSSANVQALEYDNVLFDVTNNLNVTWGIEWDQVGGHWQVWNQQAGAWVNTSATTPPNYGAWNHFEVTNSRTIGDTSCSGTECMVYSLKLNGTLLFSNVSEPAGTLTPGFTSNAVFQFQTDTTNITGTQTINEYIDKANYTAWTAESGILSATYTIGVLPPTGLTVMQGVKAQGVKF